MLNKQNRKKVERVVAIIYREGEILATQIDEETKNGRWGIPSIDIDKDDIPQDVLVKKLYEKLNIEIDVKELVRTVKCRNSKTHLTMHLFWCTIKSDLKGHENVKWFKKDELENIDGVTSDKVVMDKIQIAIDEISKSDKNNGENLNELKKWYKFFKDNLPQITALLSVFAIIVNFAVELFLYIYNRGFYDYYGVSDAFSLTMDRSTLNRFIILLAVSVIYVLYSVFAVRMWLIRKNYIWKFISWILIPFLVGLLILYVNNTSFSIYIFFSTILFIPIQWIFMWCIGYWGMDSRIFDDISGDKNVKKKNDIKIFSKWRSIDYKLAASMIMIFIFILEGFLLYNEQKTAAQNKLEYGIVHNNDETYVFLGSDGEKIVLLKCDINQDEIVLYKGDFMIIGVDGVEVSMRQFGKANLVQSTSEL